MASDTAAIQFQPGESLEWVRLEGDTRTKRSVRFIERYGAIEAIVSFGVNYEGAPARYTARLDELSRPQQPEPPAFLPGWIQTPRPPTPPTEAQISDKLEKRRAVLRTAHEKAKAAQQSVEAARRLADRAQQQTAAARAALAQQTADDKRHADAFEAAIRKGEPPPDHCNGADREALRQRVATAEAAQKTFDTENALANERLGEALSGVRRAAADVLAALIERETENLRAIETEAARQRAELVAVSHWWPDATVGALRLSSAAAALLETAPDYSESGVVRLQSNERRIAPWKTIFDRLVQGDADADFNLET